jgi:hypothetical protein
MFIYMDQKNGSSSVIYQVQWPLLLTKINSANYTVHVLVSLVY